MDWENDDIQDDQGELEDPEHSVTNSITEGRLQEEFKNCTRPPVDLSRFQNAAENIEVMSIDVTYTNRRIKDSEGNYIVKKEGTLRDQS